MININLFEIIIFICKLFNEGLNKGFEFIKDNDFCKKYENSIFYCLDENLVLFNNENVYLEEVQK